MTGQKTLFALNPAIDRAAAAHGLQSSGRAQVRSVLTPESADAIHEVLARHTDWGIGWAAGGEKGVNLRGEKLRALLPADRARFGEKAAIAARQGNFAFVYGRYPMVDAYKENWDPGHPLDLLLEHLNAPPMLDFVREVSGIATLVKADAQATLYAPGHFLTHHDDSHAAEGRRVAYVLNFTREWRPDWGGYLLFYDADGDVVAGFRPRFNALNLFLVPERHNVSYVPPFAPVGRFAITGWFRDR